MKPFQELMAIVDARDEHQVAGTLGVYVEYVRQWRPRKHWQTGHIEPGLEPSSGFIAAALAILRNA